MEKNERLSKRSAFKNDREEQYWPPLVSRMSTNPLKVT